MPFGCEESPFQKQLRFSANPKDFSGNKHNFISSLAHCEL